MTPDTPFLPDGSRRNFVKKSLAASIIAAQPTILAGLVRAQGGPAETTVPETTVPWETTESSPVSHWETTVETSDWGTTYETSDFETSVPETTEVETTEVETTAVVYDINSATANETGVGAISFDSSGYQDCQQGAVPLGSRAAVNWKAKVWRDSTDPGDATVGHKQEHKFQVALELWGQIDPASIPPSPDDPPMVVVSATTNRSEFLVECGRSDGTLNLKSSPTGPVEPTPQSQLLLDYFDVKDAKRYKVTGHVKNWTWTGLGSSAVQAKCNLEIEVQVGLHGTPSVVGTMELVFDISSHNH